MGQPATHLLGRGLGRAAAREQPERAAAGGIDELHDLVELGRPQPVAPRRRQVAGDVEDRLLAVVERRADVEPGVVVGGEPERRRDRTEVAAEPQRGAGEHDGLVGQQLVAHRPPDLQRRDVEPGRLPVGALGQPQHVGVAAGRHPLGDREHLLHRPTGLLPTRVALGLVLLAGVRRQTGPGRVADEHQRVGEHLGHGVDPARLGLGYRGRQRVARVAEFVGLAALDEPLRAARRAVDVTGRQLVGGGLGDPRGELVGLVDHHRVVVGDHRHALDRVDREQRVVGHDQVAAVGLLAGDLHEALLAEGALRRPEAVAVADADLPPLALGVAGRGVALAAAARLGLLLRPGAQLEDLRAQRALGDVDQRALVVGHALADPVEAGVVGTTLEHGVGRVDPVGQALDQPRDVALDQLVLECERCRGDHDALVVEQARHEVGQRLAGAGPRLHQQVFAGAERRRDGLRHLHLAGSLLAAERVHRVGEQVAHGRVGLAHARTLTTATRSGGRGRRTAPGNREWKGAELPSTPNV